MTCNLSHVMIKYYWKIYAASICADAATGPIGLSPGSSAAIYFKLTNGTLTSLDSGAQTTVNIFAGKAGAPQSVTVTGISTTG